MPESAATQTAADMTYAKPHEFMPAGGSNRRAARAQAAALRWLVRIAALLTAAVLVFLIGYILVMGIPNLKPELFAWEYNSENVSLTPALINTVLMTAFSLAISTPLGIFAAIWLVEYAHRGSKLVKAVRVTTETLQGIPSIVYGLFGMLFFVTKLHWGYSMIAGAFTLQQQLLAAQVQIAGVGADLLRQAGRDVGAQLGRGGIREGHDEQLVRVHRMERVGDKPDDALDQHAGLAGTGSRRNQQAAAPRGDGRRLRRGKLNFGLFGHGVSPLYEKASPAGEAVAAGD